MLRQEFIDDINSMISLRDAFMSVFAEDTKIVSNLFNAEKELEGMTGGGGGGD